MPLRCLGPLRLFLLCLLCLLCYLCYSCCLCCLRRLGEGLAGAVQLLRVGLRVRRTAGTHLRHAAAAQRLPVDLDGVLGAARQVLCVTRTICTHLGNGGPAIAPLPLQ